MQKRYCHIVLCSLLIVSASACETIDLGDNFIAPDVQLDENFFFCSIQPEVISARGCASGMVGGSTVCPGGGGCHSARSSLRLEDTPALMCVEGAPSEAVPEVYRRNLENIRFTVRDNAMSSPLYRRPLQLDSHPCAIFGAGDPPAQLIVQWISGAGP
jgi:hypothetical protein